jgi:hypothetical protein
LITLINTGVFVYAHLLTITLFGSQGSIYLTDGPIDILWNGNTYSSKTVRVDQQGGKFLGHWKRGLDMDSVTIVFAPRNVDPVTGAAYPDRIGSVPWIAAARGGYLEGADVQIDRAFFASWPQPYVTPITPAGIVTIFAGTPGEIDCTDTLVVVALEDYRRLLQWQYPKNLFQPGCRYTLYDSECTLHAADFAVPGTCQAGTTQQILQAGSIVPGGSGTFALGKVTMTSGLNSGFSRMVRTWTPPGTLALFRPLPFTVSPGDTFDAFPGCDKSTTACTAFGNLVNFAGFPAIPDATAAA